MPDKQTPPAEPDDDTQPKDELIGSVLAGDFQILRKLGQGGMASVYMARQVSLNRQVAVKILQSGVLQGSDATLLQRFEREAQAAAALNHPNIVQVYAVGQDRGLHFIAQEYVKGTNLSEFIRRKGPPGAAVAVHILRQVAGALQAAGEAGVVHRDIKPENIMITRKGVAKVADFGLAQLSQGADQVKLTQDKITMGTPLYMSPEQVQGKKLDERSDIYSLGVTAYHMLTGAPPFQGETAISVAVQHLNSQPAPLTDRRDDLPKPLIQIVNKMLAKNREERYANCDALRADLKKLIKLLKQDPDGGKISASEFATEPGDEESEQPAGSGFGEWSRRVRLFPMLGLCLLVGCCTAGIGWLMRPGDPWKLPARETLSVTKQPTATEQYLLAMRLVNNEDAWKAVSFHFPEARFPEFQLERDLAQEQLGLLYLRQKRLPESRKLFENQLAMVKNNSLRANALAAMAVIESYEGRYDESQRLIAQDLVNLGKQGHLPTPELVGLLRQVYQRNEQAMGTKRFNDFNTLFPEAPPAPEKTN